MKQSVYFGLFIAIVLGCSTPKMEEEVQTPFQFSTPEAQGMNPNLLETAYTQMKQSGFVDGVIIIKNDFIVGEKYYNGYSASTPHNVKSVSKSILAAITGIAIQEGKIKLTDKLLDFFPEYITANLDSRKKDITIAHLLTMRMGILADRDLVNGHSVYQTLYKSSNWVESTIRYPLAYNPGAVMSYNTFQTHLLSVILSKATKQSTANYATKMLFDPMQISLDNWETDAQGNHFGGNSMFFTPREMYLFGKLYKQDGKLHEQQIISKAWIDASLAPSTHFQNFNVGKLHNYQYASLWCLGEINNHKLYMAYGYGGQFIIIFPDIDLMIVTTTKHKITTTTANTQEKKMFEYISQYILPAIR